MCPVGSLILPNCCPVARIEQALETVSLMLADIPQESQGYSRAA
jgi:hypothetical protein